MKKIPLTQGQFALVDDEDFDELNKFKWYVTFYGYAARNIPYQSGKRGLIWMHRVILSAQDEQEVDHANRNKIDNRRTNLRFATRSQQNYNTKLRKDNTSGFKGVFWRKRTCKWGAKIFLNGNPVWLGSYNDKVAAHNAYREAATKYYGEFARP